MYFIKCDYFHYHSLAHTYLLMSHPLLLYSLSQECINLQLKEKKIFTCGVFHMNYCDYLQNVDVTYKGVGKII